MLAFVTPVRHPDNAASYAKVGRLLDSTLRSVCRQNDPDFRVIVVHNEMPSVHFSDSRIHYVPVGFPPPSRERTRHVPFVDVLRDKGTKNVVGAAVARELGAHHVMLIDADDYLHRELSRLANERPDHPGWYSPQGYIHTAGTRRVQFVESGFHNKNGSTSIVRTDLTAIPDAVTASSSQTEIIEKMGAQTVARLFGGHGEWHEVGVIEPMPFPAAVWEIGTGENHSGNLFSGRASRPLDDSLLETYGIDRPSTVKDGAARVSVSVRRALRRLKR